MKNFKRIMHFISSIISYSLLFILIVVGICFALFIIDQYKNRQAGIQKAPLFGSYVIVSPSMEPNIHVLDAVITMRKEANKINKGDIITYTSKDANHYGIKITHRVVGIFNTDNNGISYRTKGDNNNVEDSMLVEYPDVLGKVILKLPYVGYLQQFISTIYGWIALIVIPCVCIIVSDIKKIMNKKEEPIIIDEEGEENDNN